LTLCQTRELEDALFSSYLFLCLFLSYFSVVSLSSNFFTCIREENLPLPLFSSENNPNSFSGEAKLPDHPKRNVSSLVHYRMASLKRLYRLKEAGRRVGPDVPAQTTSTPPEKLGARFHDADPLTMFLRKTGQRGKDTHCSLTSMSLYCLAKK
jgi:hypothetical protein